MNLPFHRGDRVDWRELKNGEILRAGFGTIHAVFQCAGVPHPVIAPREEFRPHVEGAPFAVGAYTVRPGKPGKVYLHSRASGEVMEADEAVLESHLDRFWRKHF